MTTLKFQDTQSREELFHKDFTYIPSHVSAGSVITHSSNSNYRIDFITLSTVTNHGTVYFGITKIN